MNKEQPIKSVNEFGIIEWRLSNGDLHREDGPARIHPVGSKSWYLNGRRHRADGPAVELPNGSVNWWYEGDEVIFNKINTSHPLYNRMLVYYILAA